MEIPSTTTNCRRIHASNQALEFLMIQTMLLESHTSLESNFFRLRMSEHSNCAHCNQVAMLMALPSQEPWSFNSGGGHGNVVVAGANSQVLICWRKLIAAE